MFINSVIILKVHTAVSAPVLGIELVGCVGGCAGDNKGCVHTLKLVEHLFAQSNF